MAYLNLLVGRNANHPPANSSRKALSHFVRYLRWADQKFIAESLEFPLSTCQKPLKLYLDGIELAFQQSFDAIFDWFGTLQSY